MKTLLVLVLVTQVVSAAADVTWTRFKGKVKAVNQKDSTITLQNGEGDLIGVKVSSDVQIFDGKDQVPLSRVTMDQKVTLVCSPRPPEPKEDEGQFGQPLPPVRR